jgi:hypothetical protein
MSVDELIEKLKQYPPNAVCTAYEGEDTGITVDWFDETTGSERHDFISCK